MLTGGHWPAARRDVPDRRGCLGYEILLGDKNPPQRSTRSAGWPLHRFVRVCGLSGSGLLVFLVSWLCPGSPIVSQGCSVTSFHGNWGPFIFFSLPLGGLFWLPDMIPAPGQYGARNKSLALDSVPNSRSSIQCRSHARGNWIIINLLLLTIVDSAWVWRGRNEVGGDGKGPGEDIAPPPSVARVWRGAMRRDTEDAMSRTSRASVVFSRMNLDCRGL